LACNESGTISPFSVAGEGLTDDLLLLGAVDAGGAHRGRGVNAEYRSGVGVSTR